MRSADTIDETAELLNEKLHEAEELFASRFRVAGAVAVHTGWFHFKQTDSGWRFCFNGETEKGDLFSMPLRVRIYCAMALATLYEELLSLQSGRVAEIMKATAYVHNFIAMKKA